ncbi:FYVE RhoGEF and PH domain-containing protein 2 [Clonorchis sinensis]|uniref:FYVE RhoGEF and PH domain-containing protein 2 n=1 Tax=Clonorchis sinensis TaxID=79923 RepID=G7YQ82_CLOSI|nr:FYVE RhoGEF and PH domain-containing protein 2 [Clonorchis sinensis]
MEFRHIPPLLKEGPCKKIPRRSSQKRILDRHLFLFSDYLVITMPVNHLGRYQVKSEVMLNGMKLLEIAEDDDIGIPFCFRIKAKELCVELAFGNEAEKTEWWNQLQAAINQELRQLNSVPPLINATDQNLEPVSGSSAIEWVKDEQSTMCAECSAEFTVFNRRHHCRACGKVFCGTCSDYRAPIAFQGNKERVCVIDYYLINSHLKPPTPEIVESILQRMQQEPSTTEAGHLLWCRYTNGMWDLKPFSRSTKATSQCIFVTLKPRSTDISGVDNLSSGALRDDLPNDDTQQSDNVSTPYTTNSSNSVTDTLGVPASDASSLKPLQSKRVASPHHTACLSRVFCALGKDTLLSVYAARADRRAKDQLPLIGTRLFYMDYVHADAERKRLASSATLPRFFSLRCLLNSPNSLSSDDSVSSTPSRKIDKAHDTENPSKVANPIYRNHKPPPLTPKPNKSVIEAALKQPRICSNEQKGDKLSTLKHSQTLPTLLHVSSFRWTKSSYHTGESKFSENPHLTQNELAKQIASVSPTVFALLRNRLGFILLPMNTDCLAHYFEAPSIEIRTRWINSIRRTCVSYLER